MSAQILPLTPRRRGPVSMDTLRALAGQWLLEQYPAATAAAGDDPLPEILARLSRIEELLAVATQRPPAG